MFCLLPGIIQQAAGQQHGCLPGGEAAAQRDFGPVRLVEQHNGFTLFQPEAYIGKTELVIQINPIVIRLFFKGQGQDAGIYQIRRMDPGEGFDDNRLDAQIRGASAACSRELPWP